MFGLIVVLLFLIIFLSIYYYFERKYIKNERKKHSEWNNPDSSLELSQKKFRFLGIVKGRFLIFLGVIFLTFYLLEDKKSEWFLTEDGTMTNVDPEWEKRKLEEYNLFKEDAILLGRWEPADSSITDAKYMWGRSDVLIYKKNELYFIEYENTGFAKNYIQQGISTPNGNVIIFTTYHFFYPESLTFKDDTYIRKE